MLKIKSHKTVEQIAKRHRLEVSFVKNQLEMGIPIEHEHTKDKDLATDIALQHLDEIPDYYTRLKKMEADAIKHHKKFKDVKEETKSGDEGLHDWFNKSKSSDGKKGWVQLGGKWAGKPCARQPGQSSTPKCGSSKMKRALSKDEEETARRRKNRLDPNQPEKIGGTKPTNVRTEEMNLQEVKDKSGKGSGKKDACYNKVKSRYDVWPSAYASGALVKCRKVGAANWGTKSEAVNLSQQAAIAINMKKKGIKPKSEMKEDCWNGYKQEGMKKKGSKLVPNCVPVKEEFGVRYCPKCQKNETRDECKYGPKYWEMFSAPPVLTSNQLKYDPNRPHPANEERDHEYSMARSELSTIISAAKRLKKKMKGEGNIEAWVQSKITKAADYIDTAADYLESGEHKVDESIIVQDSTGNDYVEFIDIIKPQPLQPSKGLGSKITFKEESYSNWRKELVEEGQQLDEFWGKVALAAGATALPYLMKKVGEKPVNNALDKSRKTSPIGGEKRVPQMNSYTPEGDIVEDWQSVNRKDKTDGLSPAAVKAYRRENPGSKLQTAVTEKNPKGKRADRRSNFCRRMKGMKSKLTSAKTARDPDSRINKALRRWRCN